MRVVGRTWMFDPDAHQRGNLSLGLGVKAPTGKGFGSILVEQGIPQARVKRDFNPTGVVCTIEVPLLSAPET